MFDDDTNPKNDPIRELRNKINAKIQDPSSQIPVELAAAVHADLSEHEKVIGKAVDPDGFVRVGLDRLEREKAKFDADDPSEHDYEGDREKPLCGCSDPFCTIKQATVPLEVKNASFFKEGLREFRERHDGHAHVLSEIEEEYEEKRAEAMIHLRRNWIALQHEVHPDDVAEYAEMDKDDLAAQIDDKGDENAAVGD